ncbi:PAPA-1-like conserved region domain-containing protein [Trichoderma austrokoningii]
MSSRPRRSAAAKAKEVISVHARWADMSEKEDAGTTMSSRRTGRGATSRDTASSPEEMHSTVTVKLPTSKPRQSTRGGNRRGVDAFEGGEIVLGKRNRGAKKSYVIDSSPDDDEEEEEEEVEVEEDDDEDDEDEEDAGADDDDEMEDEDAEGEDDMDVDAEGEDDMDVAPKAAGRPSAKNSRSTKPRPTVKVTNSRAVRDEDDDDEDDDELSEPADSDIGDDTIVYGDQTMGDDEDAEGEEIEVAGDEDDMEEEEEEEEAEEEDDDDEMTMAPGANGGDSDLDSEGGSRAETPDLAKMTKRQRARFEDIPQEFMKLPDEIQVKKVFTAEELSMRRQEMARRRRNLSEKRNEEVKMETINKLLKKQAPKINRKAAAADSQDQNAQKPDPVFIRWVSSKSGSRVAVPDEIVEGPSGVLFGGKTKQSLALPPKLVTEVA